MQPWIIDANDMDADDILNFRSNLLHPNQPIRNFLHPENKGTMIIIGPKGFGKTLLLKAKRLSVQGQIAYLVPSGALVDKPSGSPSVAPTTEYGELRDTENYWKTLWLIAFVIAVLRATGQTLTKGSRTLLQTYETHELMSPCDIFDHILTLPVGQYHAIRNDYNDTLLPKFRHLHEAVAVFVDNIDEYYEGVLREIASSAEQRRSSRAKRSYWHLAQHGIAAAARELNQINSHAKIYVSIRREVLQGIVGDTFFGQQLRGKSVIMHYNDDDLREIICKNILNSDPADLLTPAAARDAVHAFFGDLARVTHPGTGDEEDVLDFWLRHSLGRPRDVVAIGRALAAIPPKSRTERRIREVVRGEAKTIAKAYLAEMSPHLEGFDPDQLIGLIKKNVLTPDDLRTISDAYAAAYYAAHGDRAAHVDHPFCALFKLGLLGYVARDPESNDDAQIFRLPGEESLENVGVLPTSGLYLIHPALDDVIAERNPQYFETLNDWNVVGRGRRWLRERAIRYVLKGDVVGYSAIMRDAVRNKAFLALLDRALNEFAAALDHKQRSEGDSMALIDPNPVKLLQAAQNIQRELRRSEFASEIRFGGDAGFVDVVIDGAERNIFGMAIQNAARVEPHAGAGRVVVTEEFRRRTVERFGSMFPFEFIAQGPEDLRNLEYRDGMFNIGKRTEDPIQTALHLIHFG